MADLPFHTAAHGVLNSITGDRKNASRRPVDRTLHRNRSQIAYAGNSRQARGWRFGQEAKGIGDIEDPMPCGIALGCGDVPETRGSLAALVREEDATRKNETERPQGAL